MASRRPSPVEQGDLFVAEPTLPADFSYRDDMISPGEEQALLERLEALPFKPYDFHGYLAKRRVVSFGWRYDYSDRTLHDSDAIPPFLLPLRQRAAGFAGIAADGLQQILINEYAPGAGIGWHRDKPMFEDVVAISLSSACVLRFRRKAGRRVGARLARHSAALGLSAARPGAAGVGAQHPARRSLALFRDIPKLRRRRCSRPNLDRVDDRIRDHLAVEDADPRSEAQAASRRNDFVEVAADVEDDRQLVLPRAEDRIVRFR